jgi:predicted amidohydrolase
VESTSISSRYGVATDFSLLQAKKSVSGLRIGVVQMRLATDLCVNYNNIIKYIRLARSKKITLLCFPECALTGYIRDHRKVAPRDVYDAISKLQKASDSTGVALVVGSSLPWKDRIYNAALIIRPHGRMRRYLKHTLTDYDRKYFAQGTSFHGFSVRGVNCGALICRDQSDPILPRRFKKVRVLFYLSSHYYKQDELKYKERKNKALPIARAIENRAYVAKADAVGTQGGLASVGTSMIVDPRGVVVAEAPRNKEALLELDL